MTIDEAVDIRNSPPGTHHVSLRYEAEQEIIERYLWLADETPLTVELIQAELGQDCKKYRFGVRDYWMAGERMFSFGDGKLFVHGVMICSNATLGDLRKMLQLIAKKEGAA